MPYKIKIVSKETPADEAHLLSGMERFLLRAEQHRRGLLIGLLTLLAAAGGGGGLVWYDHHQAEQALELNRQATRLFVDRPADQSAKAEENLKQAIGLYRQVVDQYPRTPMAPLSLYQLGNALVLINDIAGAIDAYRKYVATYGANKTMLGLVYQRLGYAYLLHGDRDQAVKAFLAVLDIPGTLTKDQALFELGKLEETQSRPEGALARYQELIKNYPNSPFANEAAFRIKALEVKMNPEQGKTPSSGEPGKEGGKEGE